MSGPIETARAAWGEDLPDWVLCLARECEARSQSQVAAVLGRSAALVSQVIRKKYTARMDAIEDLVRGHFMNGKVECPSLGLIPTHECREWRIKSRRAGTSNMLRVRMYRACNHCPRNQTSKTEGDSNV